MSTCFFINLIFSLLDNVSTCCFLLIFPQLYSKLFSSSTCCVANLSFHQVAVFQLSISSTCFFIKMTNQQWALFSICQSVKLLFHKLAISSIHHSSTCNFIKSPLHQCAIFITMPFFQCVISSLCHFINLPFNQLILSSAWLFL